MKSGHLTDKLGVAENSISRGEKFNILLACITLFAHSRTLYTAQLLCPRRIRGMQSIIDGIIKGK